MQPLIFRRRNILIDIRRAIGPMRDVFNALLNRHLPLIQEPHLLYFRDLYDHTVRIYELLEINASGCPTRWRYICRISPTP